MKFIMLDDFSILLLWLQKFDIIILVIYIMLVIRFIMFRINSIVDIGINNSIIGLLLLFIIIIEFVVFSFVLLLLKYVTK